MSGINDMSNDRIYSGATPKQVAEDLKPLVDFKNEGMPVDELKELFKKRLLPHLIRYDLPEFQSMFNSFPEKGAKLGADIALSYNQGVTNWQVSPGGAMLEELCGRALCSLFGFPSSSDATFMYSGTYANQEALYLALHRKAESHGFDLAGQGLSGFSGNKKLVVAISGDAHFSIRHAVRMLGLGEESIITVPMDSSRRIDVQQTVETLDRIQNEKDIFCLVTTTGTTSTGAVDPVAPFVEYCSKHDIWLHVDGAYGMAYSLVPEWKHLFSGIEDADSVCWDPHKQLGIPIPNSLLFVRQWKDFGRMSVHSSYFNREEDVEPNPGLKSPPSTRPFSALPLVASFLYQGMENIIQRLRAPLAAIRETYDYLKTQKDIEMCHEPDTGILCFRIIPEGIGNERLDVLQQSIFKTVISEGKRSISVTQLNNKTMLRILAISHTVTFNALMETVSEIRRIARDLVLQ
jgi:L-2,4-diaminobutyrate decarboxylase